MGRKRYGRRGGESNATCLWSCERNFLVLKISIFPVQKCYQSHSPAEKDLSGK